MKTIFLDIETVGLPVEKREWSRPKPESIKLGNLKDPAKIQAKIAEVMAEWEAGTDAALDPLHGRVALIGYAVDDDPVEQIEGDDEGDLLLRFMAVLTGLDNDEKHDIRIVGHNLLGFDAPFLIRRGFIMDARPPAWLVKDLFEYRPRYWLDTMRLWHFGDRSGYTKLELLCGAFGIPVKESPAGVTGATFGLHWMMNKPACRDYNRQDVEALRELWRFIGRD